MKYSPRHNINVSVVDYLPVVKAEHAAGAALYTL